MTVPPVGDVALRVLPERSGYPHLRPSDIGLLRGGAGIGAPRTLAGRAHGDPFPLPPLSSCDLALPPSCPRAVGAALVRRGDERVRSLNALDATSVPLQQFCPGLRPTAAQTSILDSVLRRVATFGKPPEVNGPGALSQLLKSKDMYSGSPVAVRPFVAEKFSVLHSGIRALPLRERLPPLGQHFVDHANSLICRPQDELNALVDSGHIQPVTPFWDMNLRHRRSVRIDLFKKLMAVGLVGLRLQIRARAALFFVEKKDLSLRLVVDGREASALHRRPPSVGLGSAAALSGIDLSPSAMKAAGARPGDPVFGASADLRQGFYQMTWLDMGSWFGFEFPEPASVFAGFPIYDEASRSFIEVSGDTLVHPVYQGLPPGWSWSLFFCNMVTADCLAVGIGRALSLDADAIPFAEEKRPPPAVTAALPIVACYVDNGNIVGLSKELVNRCLQGFLQELEHRNLHYHEVVYACSVFTCGGAIFDFMQKRVYPKPSRVWKVYKSSGELLRIGGATGDAIRVYLGHVVHVFMLLRPALSCLDRLYTFATTNKDRFARFSAAHCRELKVVKGLLLLTGVNMNAPCSSVAFCSDACPSGFALSEANMDFTELRAATTCKERWRFRGLVSKATSCADVVSYQHEMLASSPPCAGSFPDVSSYCLVSEANLNQPIFPGRFATADIRKKPLGERAFAPSDVDPFRALPIVFWPTSVGSSLSKVAFITTKPSTCSRDVLCFWVPYVCLAL